MIPIPLHVKSHYSVGLGIASPVRLVEAATERGVSAIALTDVETLAGQPRFHSACRTAGIQPITGVELRRGFDRRKPGGTEDRLILLARDAAGYRSLCRIVSRRRGGRNGGGDPVESALAEPTGLFLLSDSTGPLDRAREAGVPSESLGLLVGRAGPDDSQRVSDWAQRTRVRVLAGPEIVMASSADMATLAFHTAAHRKGAGHPGKARAASLDDLRPDDFAGIPAAIAATHELAASCRFELSAARLKPTRDPELARADAQRLRKRCAVSPRAPDPAEIDRTRRLDREIEVIARLGFVDYVLDVARIAASARQLGVPTAIRGSAAGSLVVWVLGISDIDPTPFDLLFERFLHPGRGTPPDIDLDVDAARREDLFARIRRDFGPHRVARVAAWQTHGERSAIREGLRVLGLGPAAAARVLLRLDRLSERKAARDRVTDALENDADRRVREAAPLVAGLLGAPTHSSAHPSGLVVGAGDLRDVVPLERAPGGAIITQYDAASVEDTGLIKIDLLGNHFLTEMRVAAELSGATAVLRPNGDLSGSPDAASRSIVGALDRGNTVGCYQVESPAMRSVLRRMPIRSFADLVAALAVVRPGAAAATGKRTFLRRAGGAKESSPLAFLGPAATERYPALARRLARSHGVLLFDEDLIRVLMAVGGLDAGEADALRSAIIAAGDDSAALAGLRDDFLRSARSTGAVRLHARRAWAAATRLAAYSFAEAHAISLAVLSWEAVRLRVHHPAAFGCALLDHHRALYPLRTIAAEVERWGVPVRAPDINRSAEAGLLEDDAIRVGLAHVRGVGTERRRAILRERQRGGAFRDLPDLLGRTAMRPRELRALLLAGACDDLAPLSRHGYPLVHEAVLARTDGECGPADLKDALDHVAALPQTGPDAIAIARWQALVRARNELEILGMHPSAHPMRILRAEADRSGCIPSGRLAGHAGRTVRFAGLLSARRRVDTRSGAVAFLTLEDEDGLVEARLGTAAERRLAPQFTSPGPFLLTAQVRQTHGEVRLEVRHLMPFHARNGRAGAG